MSERKCFKNSPSVIILADALDGRRQFTMGCEVCQTVVRTSAATDSCGHHKNGYCALYRLQAARDMLDIKNKKQFTKE